MFCPECGAEFRDGFSQCNACDVPLVEEPPPPEPEWAYRQLALVGRYLHLADATAIQCALRGAGFRCWLWNDWIVSLYWLVSPAIGGVCVLVDAEDWEEVEDCLRHLETDPSPPADDDVVRPQRSTWRWKMASLFAWGHLIAYSLVPLFLASIIYAERRSADAVDGGADDAPS